MLCRMLQFLRFPHPVHYETIAYAHRESDFLRGFASVGMISTGSIYLTITIPLLFIVVYCLQHVYLRTSRQLRFLDLEAKSPLYSHFLGDSRWISHYPRI